MKSKNALKKIMAIVITIAIFSYLIYIYFVPPTEGGVHIVCPTKQFLHLNCVGCGMTRFVYFIMKGDFMQALSYNFFGPFLLLVLLVIYFYFLRWSFFDKQIPKIPTWLAWTFLVFVIVYSVLRNLPIEEFRFLAPPS